MWSPTKLMRIFEILWIIAAIVSFTLAILNMVRNYGSPAEYLYMFLICGLCIIMAIIKRKSRHFILKREAMRRESGR